MYVMSGTFQSLFPWGSVASDTTAVACTAECSWRLASGSALPARPVPEPAGGCEPENSFFRRDLPVTAAGRGLRRDTCAGGKQEVTSALEPASRSGADGSGVGA